MKRNSRKDVNLVMADVRHPQKHVQKQRRQRKINRSNVIWGSSIILITLLVAIFVLDLGGGARSVYQKFKDLAFNVQNFNGGTDYLGILDSLDTELGGLDRKARLLAAIPKLKEIPEIINGLRDIVGTIKDLSGDLEEIGGSGLQLAFNGEGERLIEILDGIQLKLTHLRETSEGLLAKAKEFGVEGEDIDLLSENLIKTEKNLGNIVSFLNTETSRRLILLFENPSELRPNGGFAGSYGVLVLEKGSVKSLEVNDIYYPDKFLPLKVVPPLQLQAVTPNWGARDTGWFFDFPKSSENLLEYLEASSVYSKENVKFDGVVAINVRVIEDLLKVTGPIEIPEYGLVLNYSNFLEELQREVEANKVPGENPKAVLSFVAPKLIEMLGSATSGSSDILNIFVSRARNKDIQMFFKDEAMQSMAFDSRTDGGVYQEPDAFVGDYLALVNANIAGGKTDIFVKQKAVLQSELSADGNVSNTLTVTRSHQGQNEVDPWYNHINQDFFKIFTPAGSSLTYLEGGKSKEIIPKVNYAQNAYETDPDVTEIENTRTLLQPSPDGYAEEYLESGKRVFATWFNVLPGEEGVLKVKYNFSGAPVSNDQVFTFVLDKQSGSEMDFEYAIVAPAGYYWSESGSDLFRYKTSVLPSRLELKLTLKQQR
ncbi:MAG: hypothetical protein UX31_C0010G0023 [Candidatus Nomurabacteria bacterium GW2011_GWA1_46_11]|uniref:DUF4012 domain-containing protein n=1 Tax=Candidatus Nomurabacteria bacterium GW2011_GWA1_46_11 TaxID=1618732 RepID=A0A0G1NNH3_9BACT|nr:MAG: hypothetical protein UX31_C0010G0023 [Candidatus Nomurabacteria bacterium GW2011_GWA1_46_11]